MVLDRVLSVKDAAEPSNMELVSPVLVVVVPIVLFFSIETTSPSFDVFFKLIVMSCKTKMAVRGKRKPKKCWKKMR